VTEETGRWGKGNKYKETTRKKYKRSTHLIKEKKSNKDRRKKRTVFWDIMQCSPIMSTDVSGEHVTSIFRVEE
jgi:hypothetical protein